MQQALVDTHGSQCGFCTPGFVMAMFAFHHGHDTSDQQPPDDNTIHDVLAGNLCRCTGFRPIVEAVRLASVLTASDVDAKDAATLARLQSLRAVSPVEVGTGNQRFLYRGRSRS